MTGIGLHVGDHGGWVVARITGEIDLTNVKELGERLRSAVANDSAGLVLDLSSVRYLDSTGLRLLFRLLRELGSRQQELHLVVPEEATISRILVLGGVAAAMPVYPTLESRDRQAGVES